MSLIIEHDENDENKCIAGIYKNPANLDKKKFIEASSKLINYVNYIDEDDFDEDTKKLRKIRIMNDSEVFFPCIPDFHETKQVDRLYVVGESGCGKSTFIRAYIQKFKLKYSKSKVLLFSSKDHDEVLDDLKIERVQIDDDIVANPLTLQEISYKSSPVLAVFDDIEDFKSRKINNEIARLRDEIMRNGRSYGIFSIFVHHDPCDYKATKAMLFEANKIVFFPKQCGHGAYNYLMEKKLRLSKEMMKLINTVKSRYVCVNKGNPRAIISDKYLILN